MAQDPTDRTRATTLDQFTTSPTPTPDPAPESTPSERPRSSSAPADHSPVLTRTSCPWCLAPADSFRERNGRVGCGNCTAIIPIGAEWYERGEKIVV